MGWEQFRTRSGIVGHERGDGALLAVVLHGGPGLSDYTEALCDEIFDGGDGRLRVVRYQQRGQAPSTVDGPISIRQHVADIVEVIDHFGADRVVLGGHSYGAFIAFHFALDHPDRLAGMLLLDPLGAVGDGGQATMGAVISGRLTPEALQELNSLADRGLDPDAAETRQFQLIWPGYFADPAAAPPFPEGVWVSATAGALEDGGERLASGELERRLPEVDVPVLYQICRASPIDPEANAKSAQLFPRVIVDELPCGHFPWLERPGTAAAATRKLLAALDS